MATPSKQYGSSQNISLCLLKISLPEVKDLTAEKLLTNLLFLQRQTRNCGITFNLTCDMKQQWDTGKQKLYKN